ncbi:methyl-accepting chemotaxis protein [Pseudenhygromyxa sp. WMMC2535]|uniref:methyl-accepting chemotaxis protein n=1 Tax=Pseudenhygromyxa sp. WMMC2535 TaxID=2712867 RepID=UPI0020D103CD|nr:methyl-accepting chemotaxis protein [Pseudenhygromyxa sp. WMMC2535]
MGSLARSAEHVSGAVSEVSANTESILATTDALDKHIAELDLHCQGITKLLENIREVAARSDLLALNGALEANRAGEAGRGFAIVSTEMRQLAERVTGTVADVRRLVNAISKASADAVNMISLGHFLAEGTTKAAQEIAGELRQQSSDTSSVSQSTSELARSITQTSASTTQTRTAAAELQRQAERLDQLIHRFELRPPSQPSERAQPDGPGGPT